MQVTGTLQYDAWQRQEFPPVEQVAGGLWSVPVPIIGNPLRYVLAYLIEHDAGFVVVDPGWNHPDSWRALAGGLAACGVPLTSVTAILVTHAHPDHHGLSAAVREQSGAWIGMHAAEDRFVELQADRGLMRDGMSIFLQWCGAPDGHLAELVTSRQQNGNLSPMVRADRLIEHGDRIDVPGLRLRAVWTPGHTPGHLCFHDEKRDLLLTGDHILPRITPNISSYELSSNPLADYLASLDKLRAIEPSEVLPAHEYRFAGLQSRLDDLAEHHHERLAETEQILASGMPQTAWQIATQVTWSRSWSELESFQRQAAIGEVLSHLRQLQARDLVAQADIDGVGMWRGVSRPGNGGTPASLSGDTAVPPFPSMASGGQ